MVGGVAWFGIGGIDVGWLVDAGDGFANEEAGGDELGEAEGGDVEAGLARRDAQQQVGDHGGEELEADGVFGAAEELAQLEVLMQQIAVVATTMSLPGLRNLRVLYR